MIKSICEQIKAELTAFLDLLKDNYVEECFAYDIEDGWYSEDTYIFEVSGLSLIHI